MTTTLNKIEVALLMDALDDLKNKVEKDIRGFDRNNLSKDGRQWVSSLQDKYFEADALYYKLLNMDDTGLDSKDLMFKEVPMDEAKVA
jgi:hypothetical protein